MSTYKRLGEILIEKRVIQPSQLEEALRVQAEQGGLLGEILIELGMISPEELAAALATQLNLDFCAPADEKISDEVLQAITPLQAQNYRVIPLEVGDDRIRVATAAPHQVLRMDRFQREVGKTVRWAVTTPEQIAKALERYYMGRLNSVDTVLAGMDEKEYSRISSSTGLEVTDLTAVENLANEAPIVRMVNLILAEGVRLGASDIHLEPFEQEIHLRYRVDGVLYPRNAPPLSLYPAVVSRLKLMAGMDITEKRLPQDGRIRVRLGDRDLDLRVAVAPTLHGESVVMRVLNRQSLLLDLEELGLTANNLKRLERLIRVPHGMILVTGPTGSGKTTTLYAALSRLNQPERKIITVEDPVEYELKGVNQLQVNPKINWGFAQGLRTIVRHDPDIILVGEIRDRETAEMAIQAALTGHLVFSTLHTNDSASAFTRLIDMGIEEFLIASTVRGVLAQRLVRRICPECRVKYEPTPQEASLQQAEAGQTFKLYHGKGCEHCNGIGYRGQLGLFELLIANEEISDLVMKRAPASKIREAGMKNGMRTLRQEGWEKVKAGLTTVSEIVRVTFE